MSSTYRVCGVTLTSDRPLSWLAPVEPGGAPPDVGFSCVSQPPADGGWRDRPPVYTSTQVLADGSALFTLREGDGCDVLEFGGLIRYHIWPTRIACELLAEPGVSLVQALLLGPVLALWLERTGVPALHASAVCVGRRAVGLLSFSTGGKSTLAAAMVSRGHPLLADDLLAIDRVDRAFMCRPAFPSIRLWSEVARHFVERWEDLERVEHKGGKCRVPVGPGGIGRFCGCPQPLGALVAAARRPPNDPDETITLIPMARRDAVVDLVRHSLAARSLHALGHAPARLDLLSDMVTTLPVWRLSYPSVLERLPEVCATLERALAREMNSGVGTRAPI